MSAIVPLELESVGRVTVRLQSGLMRRGYLRTDVVVSKRLREEKSENNQEHQRSNSTHVSDSNDLRSL